MKKMKIDIVSTLILLIGIICIIFGSIYFVKYLKMAKRCNRTVIAKIVGVDDETVYSNDSWQHNYTPTFEYTYNEHTYIKKSIVSSGNKNRYVVGETEDIMINSDNPEEFMTVSNAETYMALGMLIVGIIIVAVGSKLAVEAQYN